MKKHAAHRDPLQTEQALYATVENFRTFPTFYCCARAIVCCTIASFIQLRSIKRLSGLVQKVNR